MTNVEVRVRSSYSALSPTCPVTAREFVKLIINQNK